MLGQGQLGWAIRLGTELHTWAPEASHNDVIAKASNPDSPDPSSAGTLRQSPKLSTPSFTQETLPASLGFSRLEQERRYKTSLYPPGLFEG